MKKKYFALKLNPSRPDFATTLNAEEKTIMQQHSAYWRESMKNGLVVVFGPLLHPAGVYGPGIPPYDGSITSR